MADIRHGPSSSAPGRERRFDASCMMCGRAAGQVVDGVFLHHPDCAHQPIFDGGLPRCCVCGGRLYFEPTDSPMSTFADREAARRYRPTAR